MIGWPMWLLAFVGIWRLLAEGARDRAALAILAWVAACLAFLGLAVMRVDAPFQRYAAEFSAASCSRRVRRRCMLAARAPVGATRQANQMPRPLIARGRLSFRPCWAFAARFSQGTAGQPGSTRFVEPLTDPIIRHSDAVAGDSRLQERREPSSAPSRARSARGRVLGELEVVFVVDGSPDASLRILRRVCRRGRSARGSSSSVETSGRLPPSPPACARHWRLFRGARRRPAGAARTRPRVPQTAAVGRGGRRLRTPDGRARTRGRRARVGMVLAPVPAIRRQGHAARAASTCSAARARCATAAAAEGGQHQPDRAAVLAGFRRAFVPYERRARLEGRSAWTFGRKFRYALDSIFSFTDLPIQGAVAPRRGRHTPRRSSRRVTVFVAWSLGRIPCSATRR